MNIDPRDRETWQTPAMHETLERASEDGLSEAETLLDYSERLRHWDRLSTLARVAATMAHELGTPLNVVEGRATMLLSGDPTPADVKKNAQIIVQQSLKMTAILRDLVTFARRAPVAQAKVELDAVVRSAISLAERSARAHNVRIVLDIASVVHDVLGDADRLMQAAMNLIMNGIQAMPDGGTLTVTLRTELTAPHDDPEGPRVDHICLAIADTGPGVADAARARLFHPFFTTKTINEGVGLGLAIAQAIAKDHRGFIELQAEAGKGACFLLRLPKGNVNAE